MPAFRRVLSAAMVCALGSALGACSKTPAPAAPAPAAARPKPVPAPLKGGMWLPSQLPQQAGALRELGLQIAPEQLSDPLAPPLAAVVSLGGCSASFVSPDGLIVTNHHCITGALQYNSTPQQNLLELGFLAKTRADERSIGPTGRVFVTRSFRDVTEQIRAGLDRLPDDRARHRAVESRTKTLVQTCESKAANVRCDVAGFFGGASYFLIERLEIQDVRLVYAPSEGVGNYGGEIDNWRWPRHTGDFAFYRAYVAPDGSSAPFAAANVPYRPSAFLKPTRKALAPGDLVMVAGYPGRTYRLLSAFEVREAVEWAHPFRIRMCEEYVQLLSKITQGNAELDIKARPLRRGLDNAFTYYRGVLEGLKKGDIVRQRSDAEARLQQQIDRDPELRKQLGTPARELTELLRAREGTRHYDAILFEMLRMSVLLDAAVDIVRMAAERPKRDAERDPEFQERNWDDLEQASAALEKRYSPDLDRPLLALALRRARSIEPAARREQLLQAFGGKPNMSEAEIDGAVAELFAKTRLGDTAHRIQLLKSASSADLTASSDPLIQLAVRLKPLLDEQRQREESEGGAALLIRPRYVAALRLITDPIAPDANGTLRVTLGTVRGYVPAAGGPEIAPFTSLNGVVSKHTGQEPFAAPQPLLDAARARSFGPYVDARLGDVPVNFLADCDITGGNSGSPTLDAEGRLVGLAFDGNYEAMASDWVFMPSITRSIHVDFRYMAWVMDVVDRADHLLKEMGVEPAIP